MTPDDKFRQSGTIRRDPASQDVVTSSKDGLSTAYCRAKTGSVRVGSAHDPCRHRHFPWSPYWNFYSRMSAVSRRRSRIISVASRELAGSSRRFFIREHREQKLNMFNFFSWQRRSATDTAGRQAGFYTALTE